MLDTSRDFVPPASCSSSQSSQRLRLPSVFRCFRTSVEWQTWQPSCRRCQPALLVSAASSCGLPECHSGRSLANSSARETTGRRLPVCFLSFLSSYQCDALHIRCCHSSSRRINIDKHSELVRAAVHCLLSQRLFWNCGLNFQSDLHLSGSQIPNPPFTWALSKMIHSLSLLLMTCVYMHQVFNQFCSLFGINLISLSELYFKRSGWDQNLPINVFT